MDKIQPYVFLQTSGEKGHLIFWILTISTGLINEPYQMFSYIDYQKYLLSCRIVKQTPKEKKKNFKIILIYVPDIFSPILMAK